VLDPSITIDILANYFLLAAYAGVVVVVVTVLTDHVLEPRLKALSEADSPTAAKPEAIQHRGLALSVLAMAAVIAGGAALGLAPNGPLRDETGALKPFYKSFVAIVAIALFAGALVFGIANGRLKRDADVYDQMRGALADTAPFMLLVFFAAHFAAFLDWSNLAVISAAAGAAWLKTIDLGGPALVIAFCLLTSALNLVLPSTSAKWALMAPAAVPMMMSLGISPEMTAAAYRLGASATELVTPTAMTPIVLLFAQRYAPRMGLGRFMAIMTPYMLGLLTAALALLWFWTAFDLPLGPTGARMSYTPPG
jgi:aminobenzoyl-glutamate transport protein